MIFYPRCFCHIIMNLYDYGAPKNATQHAFIVQPKSISVHLNSYLMADTCHATFRYEDFPIDPRLIKSAKLAVNIFDSKGLKNLSSEDLQARESDVVFVGFLDSLQTNLDTHERTVSVECRDYTSLFIDATFDNANLPDAEGKRRKKITLNRPLADIFADLIKNVPGAGKIEVEDRTDGQISNFRTAVGQFSLIDGKTSTEGDFYYVQRNQTYWDVIVSIASAAGVIVYIDRDKLVISNPRILYEGSAGGRSKKTIPFIYGQNVKALELYRNLGKKRRFNVRLRSFNRRSGKVIEVGIPKDATAAWSQRTGISRKVQQLSEIDSQGTVRKKPAPGHAFSFTDKTKDQLIFIGEKIFEEIVRQQVEGSLETREMRVSDTDGLEFDITKLRNGIPLQIEIASSDLKNILRFAPDGRKIGKGERIAYLLNRGYPRGAAESLVEAVAEGTGRLRPTFYTREAAYSFDSGGFKLRVSFVNYIYLGETEDGQPISG